MKRRDFLVSAGTSGLLVPAGGLLVPALARAVAPCPPPKVGITGGQSASTACGASATATSDWQARISGPRVVWYHGFQSKAEVDQFRWAGDTKGNDPGALSADAPNVVLEQGTGPGGMNCLAITRPANRDISESWWRPFSPFTGATNGRGTNDPAAGGAIALQTWSPQGNPNELNQWTKGWYSQNSALGPDGVDFWIQMRVKMDPAVYSAAMQTANDTGGKFFEVGIAAQSNTNQNLVTVLNAGQGKEGYHHIYADGGLGNRGNGAVYGWTAGYSDIAGSDPNWVASYDDQIGSSLGHCNYAGLSGGSISDCWAFSGPWNGYPSGGWDTVLYHITPGPVTSDPGDSANYYHGPSTCYIQVYAAHQGETSYAKIRDQQYQLHGWDYQRGEGYQALLLTSYFNNYTLPVGYTSRYAQIVFAKGDGTSNIPIPCPQI